MSGAIWRKTRQLGLVIILSAAAGLVYAPLILPKVTLGNAVEFAIQGFIIGGFFGYFEVFIAAGPMAPFLRRRPFAIAFLIKTAIVTVLILLALILGGYILFPERFGFENQALQFFRDIGFSLSIALIVQFVLMVRSVIGGRVLANIVLGRYHRPLDEDRIFMFLDIAGSTGHAERLGGVGAHRLISQLFSDVAQATIAYDGETHRYIGDEVVVTWPLDLGLADARCLRCYFDIRRRVAANAAAYERAFGAVPEFRVGIHGGPVVAGECGTDKREIVYFGNTINAAARIEQACKEFDRKLLISGDLLGRMVLPPDYAVEEIGPVELRGLGEKIILFSVDQRAQTARE